MQGTTLRELARAFSKGELGRDQYRRDRSKLVTAIVAGEVAVRNIDFPPPIKPPRGDGAEPTEPRPRRRRAAETDQEPEATTQITPARPRAPAPTPARAKQAGPSRLIAVVAVVGIAAALGWYFSSRPASEKAPGTTTAPADATAESTEAAVETQAAAEDPRAEAGRALISQFLQDRSWSAERMGSFQSDWSALDADQRTAALNSADAGRLASAIYERLLAQRALSGLGEAEESLAKQRELVGFASAIGISDPRLSVPEPAVSSETATASPDAANTD